MLPLTIVVCTYNRARLAAQAVESVYQGSSDLTSFEVLVVDNNSTDNTHKTVLELQTRYLNLRYVREPRQGLSHARNRGWQEAESEFVGYLDDDAKATPRWLSKSLEQVECGGADLFGGPYAPFYESPPPEWYQDEFGSMTRGDEERLLGKEETLSGGNFFIRRSLLIEVGGFRPDLGMTGGRVAYGEETQLQHYLRETKPELKILYCPELLIHHLVRADKVSLGWRARQSWALGRDAAAMWRSGKVTGQAWPEVLARLAWASLILTSGVMLGWAVRNRQRYPTYLGYLYGGVLPYLSYVARACGKTKTLLPWKTPKE